MAHFRQRFVVVTAIILTLLQFGLVLSSGAAASRNVTPPVDPCTAEGKDSLFCQDKNANPPGSDPIDNAASPLLGKSSIFYKIIQTVTIVTGAISIIMIMVGGFKYIVSGGDGPAIKGAKDTILYAVIGLAVAIFSQSIITFVLSNI